MNLPWMAPALFFAAGLLAGMAGQRLLFRARRKRGLSHWTPPAEEAGHDR